MHPLDQNMFSIMKFPKDLLTGKYVLLPYKYQKISTTEDIGFNWIQVSYLYYKHNGYFNVSVNGHSRTDIDPEYAFGGQCLDKLTAFFFSQNQT